MQLLTTNNFIKSIFLFTCFAFLQLQGNGQRNIQVNSIDEFTLRDQQLLNGWSPYTSFTVRPLFISTS
ncbi:MAG: hypothetical protein RL377_1091, partial [Bacteroidota bacterium]